MTADATLSGDVNLDGVVDALDIAPLLDHIGDNDYQVEADLYPVGSPDGVLDALDIDPLAQILRGTSAPPLSSGDVAVVSVMRDDPPRFVNDSGTLGVFVDATINEATFDEGGFGIRLESTNPGVIRFTDVRVLNPEFVFDLTRWSSVYVNGASDDSVEELMGLALGAGLGVLPEDSTGPVIFAEIDYEVISSGVTEIVAGPITSRPGAFLVDHGRDVTDRVVFESGGPGSLIIGRDSIVGDVNLDGVVDGLDLAPFVDFILNGGYQAEADIDQNGIIDGLDIAPLVTISTGGTVDAVPEPASTSLIGCVCLLFLADTRIRASS